MDEFKLCWIPIGSAATNDQQHIVDEPIPPREESKVDDLVSSIKLHGILSPLLLREVADGLQVVCGQRRYRAALAAGLESVPAVIARLEDAEAIRCFLSHEIVRRPLTFAGQDLALTELSKLNEQKPALLDRSAVPTTGASPNREASTSSRELTSTPPTAANDSSDDRDDDFDSTESNRTPVSYTHLTLPPTPYV